MNNIIEIVKCLENSGLLLKGVSETIECESKEQKRGFPSMLLGKLSASLLGNILAGKGVSRLEKERYRRDKVKVTRSRNGKRWL